MGSSGTKTILFLPLSHGDDEEEWERAEEGGVGEDFVDFSSSTEAEGEAKTSACGRAVFPHDCVKKNIYYQ